MRFVSFKRAVILVVAIAIFGSLATAVYLVTAQETYTIYDGEQLITISGSYETIQMVVDEAGLELRPKDLVEPPRNETAAPGATIRIQRARPVTIRTEDETRTVWTQHTSLGGFLAETGTPIQRTDQIFADGTLIPFNQINSAPLPQNVEVGRFLTITIIESGNQQVIRTAKQTVGEALQESGITVYAADGITPPLGTWLEPNLVIQINRSFPVSIHVDGRILQTRTHHANPIDVLAEAGIGLVGADYTQPDEATPINPGDTIYVIRVTEDFRLQDNQIPFQTLWQASDQLLIDNQAVIQAGVPGIRRQRVRVRYENGLEVNQTVDGEWVAQEAVNQIIGYGTRIELGTIQTEAGPRQYWRKVRMRVTSYTAATSGKERGDPGYGITASGVTAGYGVVAIDRAVVPFKSYVFVPGYGIGFAGDTGGGVRGRWIDLGYDEDAYKAWSGYIDVYYLTPVPMPEDINYLLPTVLP